MANAITPVARALYLCDAATATGVGKVHLSGVFNAIRAGGYPHAGTRVVAFAQLTGGVGVVPTYLEVRHAGRDETVYRTSLMGLRFPDRATILQVAVHLTRCTFPYPGLYTVELFCHNQFIGDTTLQLLELGEANGR